MSREFQKKKTKTREGEMSSADEKRGSRLVWSDRTIAVDRFLFLEEQEGVKSVNLVVGWEYEVSPRNLVLVAEKW